MLWQASQSQTLLPQSVVFCAVSLFASLSFCKTLLWKLWSLLPQTLIHLLNALKLLLCLPQSMMLSQSESLRIPENTCPLAVTALHFLPRKAVVSFILVFHQSTECITYNISWTIFFSEWYFWYINQITLLLYLELFTNCSFQRSQHTHGVLQGPPRSVSCYLFLLLCCS